MAFTTRDGVRLHWDEQGEGTPVLLVMGATYSSRMWYPAIPALARHHRVIWFDNRGFGQSEGTDSYSIGDLAQDALAVLDAAGVERAHVYGVSLGGVITQEIARQAPERVLSLVLGCTGILSSDKPRLPRWLRFVHRLPKPITARLRGGGGYGSACPPERAAHDRQVLAQDPPAIRAVYAQQEALRTYVIEPDDVARFAVPALVLHGDEDRLVPLAWGQELAEVLPGAELRVYPGAAHNYLVAVGEQANADVLEFLSRVPAA